MVNIIQQKIKKNEIIHTLNVAYGRDIQFKLVSLQNIKNLDIDLYNEIYKEIQKNENDIKWWDLIFGKYHLNLTHSN
jgi:hypothetical protein